MSPKIRCQLMSQGTGRLAGNQILFTVRANETMMGSTHDVHPCRVQHMMLRSVCCPPFPTHRAFKHTRMT